ncbi:MAG TPA: aconitate hydratase [Solirubrobacteraceae bacterium]|nr:aconitate hydratase [Solirubrobacteraceae bacterium]
MSENSFGAKNTLEAGGRSYEIFRLDALQQRFDVSRLPFSLKVLLENLLRTEGSGSVGAADVEALASWDAKARPSKEIAFTPARVLMQDLTGVPAVVDLAAMRDAMAGMGGDPAKINPLVPAELVIDHSVQVDAFGTRDAFRVNAEREFERNQERYRFLRWGQGAFDEFAVVPPDTGIVHQVNLEYLARVVFTRERTGSALPLAYPDTLVGTDSHTTMVNGLGVLGWGVGGIEAEAAMLGQPMSMLIPQVLGFRLHGQLPEGATATDLVLTVTQMLRERGVVGMFVEFYGAGLADLPIADRATIGNMSPEFGSTCAIFPIDAETLTYLELSGRAPEQIALVEAYAKEQGLWHDERSEQPTFSDTIELDLASVEPSIAGPKRPQDRIALSDARESFHAALHGYVAGYDGRDEADAESFPTSDPPANGNDHPRPDDGGPSYVDGPDYGGVKLKTASATRCTLADGSEVELDHGHVVIAAITSCTNTSNPSVMIGAGILARNALARGLRTKPWVKTSLAPGSKVVTEYLDRAGLTAPLEQLGFNLVGYGCTTCIGNSGPLPEEISAAVAENDLAVVSVLSGNRNFEGRINPDVKMNYLASPPLCVAYALAGTMDIDIVADPLGHDEHGDEVYLRDIWPSAHEVADTVGQAVRAEMFRHSYGEVFAGDERWNGLAVPQGERFAWEADSTYVRLPPFFQDMPAQPEPLRDVSDARVLALLGDSVTTDHISPAGSIKRDGPAGVYLQEHGVQPRDFNSYGARRGNHEVMMRGTFANIRLRNLLTVPGAQGGSEPLPEGGFTRYLADGSNAQMPIYDAAMRYIEEGIELVVLAGKEYGTGSSRDWAAKGTRLLGVRAVIAQSFERIHRSNLIGMGVLPLQFPDGQGARELGLSGEESFTISGLAAATADGGAPPDQVRVSARKDPGDGSSADAIAFDARVRIDTPREAEYFRHGGILQYVLRGLLEA